MDTGLLEPQGNPGREYTGMGQEPGPTKHRSAAGPLSPKILGRGFSERTVGLLLKHISVWEARLVAGKHRRNDFMGTQRPLGPNYSRIMMQQGEILPTSRRPPSGSPIPEVWLPVNSGFTSWCHETLWAVRKSLREEVATALAMMVGSLLGQGLPPVSRSSLLAPEASSSGAVIFGCSSSPFAWQTPTPLCLLTFYLWSRVESSDFSILLEHSFHQGAPAVMASSEA